ncbi:MAG: membrane or secreted protein [Nonlabens sp.]
MDWKLFLIAFGLLAIAFAGIAIKIWAKKDGKFAGTCASQSPFLNKNGESCSLCGKAPDEQDCKNPSPETR